MGMTIDDHIEVLKSYNHGFTAQAGNLQDSIDVAVDTMCKYQKIEKIIEEWSVDNGAFAMSESYWLNTIRKVIEDGSENNHHASNT